MKYVEKKKEKVVVYDAIMGSGKTYDAIQRMKNNKGSFLYVTPYLDEVNRIISQVPGVSQPRITSVYDDYGHHELIYKRKSLLRMANKDINMATTHSLFSKLHRNDYEFFENYDLVLDEVLTPIKLIKMSKDDIQIAFNEGLLVLNERTGEVSFTGEVKCTGGYYNGVFYSQLKQYCDTSNVVYVNNRLLVWAFPPEIFKCFKSVTILTYLFKGSLLSSYFEFYKIPYEVISKPKFEEDKIKKRISSLLNIYEGSCNRMGDYPSAFCSNWLKNKNSSDFKKIKTSVSNLLERHFKTPSQETGFTTFKAYSSRLKGKGYSKGFIPVNERATNKYAHKKTMVYLANRYLNPNEIDFFRSRGVVVNQDEWALSELLQWIWRGRIRMGKSMNIFIPSKRMRDLLKEWLNNREGVNNESCLLVG